MSHTACRHCKAVSKSPVVAETTINVKTQFLMDLFEFGVSAQRSKPWGIIFPPSSSNVGQSG